MSEARDLWDEEPEPQSFYRTRMRSGRCHVYAEPPLPGRKSSDPVRKDHPLLLRWMGQHGFSTHDELPVRHDYTEAPCPRCGSIGKELHHWAPKEYFGKHEAEEWPQEEICTECHAEWHERMNAWAEAIELLAEWEEDPVRRRPATQLNEEQALRAERVAGTLTKISRSGRGRVSDGAKYLSYRLTRLVKKSRGSRSAGRASR